MAIFQNCRAGNVADAGRRLDVSGVVARIVAELLHQRRVDGISVDWEHVHQRAIGGIADGLLFVGQRSLGGGTAQRATELSANGALIGTTASARAITGAPSFASRTACRGAEPHWRAGLG